MVLASSNRPKAEQKEHYIAKYFDNLETIVSSGKCERKWEINNLAYTQSATERKKMSGIVAACEAGVQSYMYR